MEKEYIEREALKEKFNGNTTLHYTARRIIDETPAADVVKVRHGRLVDSRGNPIEFFDYCGRACDKWGNALYRPVHCSECHTCLAGMNGRLFPYQRKYCSNCGAEME